MGPLLFILAACGDKSAVQRDSGSCEESGRVLVPANPETGASARCVIGTPEQVCNLRDLKLDPVTNECSPVTDEDVRMLYLFDQNSALRHWDSPTLAICIDGDAYPLLSGDDQQSLREKLLRAAQLWLAPLEELGVSDVQKRLVIIEPKNACPINKIARVLVVADPSAPCESDRRACVHYAESLMYLRNTDGLTDDVIVHEFGHIFGLADLYIDKEFRPTDPADYVTGCLTGFFGSTMCHSRSDLGPADLVGIKNMFCAVAPNANCKKPKAWNRAFFGTDLAFCTGGVENEISFSFLYDRGKALLNQVPYSGNLTNKTATGASVQIVETNENPPVAETYSILEFAEIDTTTKYTWDIPASTLSGAPLNCTLAPWFKLL